MTIKHSKFADSVASSMDGILNDESFKKIFAKPELKQSPETKDPAYGAFRRIASTSSSSSMDANDGASSSSTKSPTDIGDIMNIDDILGPSVVSLASKKNKKTDKETTEESSESSSSSTKTKKKVKKADFGLALEHMVNSLVETSAVLDTLGMNKSSSAALGLLDSIIREASRVIIAQEVVDQMADRVDSMTPEDILSKHMEAGYAYELKDGSDWKDSQDDVWETEVIEPTGNETYVGEREVDGQKVCVFTENGKYFAQVPQNATETNSADDKAGVEAHRDNVTQTTEETQKDPSNRHEPPPASLPLAHPGSKGHLHLDYNKDDDTTASPHRDNVTQTTSETQKVPGTRHEPPPASLPLATPGSKGHLHLDYNKDDDAKAGTEAHRDNVTQTTEETQKDPPNKHNPPPQSLSPNHPKGTIHKDYSKDLYNLTSSLKAIEEWIKK